MNKQIQIKSVEKFKEGNTNGKDWCIFKVVCSGDDEMNEFSTFNDYRDKIGQQFQGEFDFNQKFKNWQEISASKAEELNKHDELLGALREIYSIVSDIKVNLDK